MEFDENRGKDTLIFNYQGDPNLVRAYFSRDTLKNASGAGGALAVTSILTAALGPLGAVSGVVISVIVYFGVNAIFDKCGPNGISFTVNILQTSV